MFTEFCVAKVLEEHPCYDSIYMEIFSISFAQILIITTEFFRCDFWNWSPCTQTLFYFPFRSYFLLPLPLLPSAGGQ